MLPLWGRAVAIMDLVLDMPRFTQLKTNELLNIIFFKGFIKSDKITYKAVEWTRHNQASSPPPVSTARPPIQIAPPLFLRRFENNQTKYIKNKKTKKLGAKCDREENKLMENCQAIARQQMGFGTYLI